MSVYQTVNDELKRYDELSISENGTICKITNTKNQEPLDITIEKDTDKYILSGIDSLNNKVKYELDTENEIIEWFQMRPWY